MKKFGLSDKDLLGLEQTLRQPRRFDEVSGVEIDPDGYDPEHIADYYEDCAASEADVLRDEIDHLRKWISFQDDVIAALHATIDGDRGARAVGTLILMGISFALGGGAAWLAL